MRKIAIFMLILITLFVATSCGKTEIPDFSVPTPAAPAATPSPTPEPKIQPLFLTEEMVLKRATSQRNQLVRNAYVSSYGGMMVDGFDKNSLKEVEAASVIVLATVLKSEQIDATSPAERELGAYNYTTVTTLGIEKVFKNQYNEKIGEHLIIEELCHIAQRSDGDILFTDGCYRPTEEYGTYLLFLEKITQASAEYTPISRHYGKYPVTPEALKAKEADALTYEVLELASNTPDSPAPYVMKEIFKEVCDKYFTDEMVLAVLAVQEAAAK